jgi:hypothetical protein
MPKKGQFKANATKRSKQQRKYNSTKKQKENRAARNTARAAAIKNGKAKKGDNKDVGHIKDLKSGGSKSVSNTRVQSRKTNRAHGGRIGDKKGIKKRT